MQTMEYSVIIITIALLSICCAQFNFEECLKTKNCLFHPAHCEEKGNCESVVSYAPQPDGWVVIELLYNATPPDTKYISVGFSEDFQMGDDAVTHCGFDETNQAGVFLSRNVGHRNIPLNLTDENTAEYVKLLEASHTPNSIYCKFQQKIEPDEAAQNENVPNLNRTYRLLLAYGPTNNYKVIGIHSVDEASKDYPTFMSVPVNVATLEKTESPSAKPKPKRTLVLVHGILMLLAWMWFVASAITAARYLREHWPETMPFGLKIWFHLHRTMNYLAVLLNIIAVLLVFIGKDWRWTGPAVGRSSQKNLSAGAFHSLIGAIAVGIMLIQPMGALLRCDQGTKYRPWFNWSHRIFGLVSFFLSQVTILLAVIFFRVWIARWIAILAFVIYLILLILMILLAQKSSSLKGQQVTSVTYETGGRHYRGEQIKVTTRDGQYGSAKRSTAIIVLAFSGLGALLTIIMMILILVSIE